MTHLHWVVNLCSFGCHSLLWVAVTASNDLGLLFVLVLKSVIRSWVLVYVEKENRQKKKKKIRVLYCLKDATSCRLEYNNTILQHQENGTIQAILWIPIVQVSVVICFHWGNISGYIPKEHSLLKLRSFYRSNIIKGSGSQWNVLDAKCFQGRE